MHQGYGIVLAWPETKCKQAGAWYDSLMTLFCLNKNGYYKVGHAALILLDKETNSCKYFDFGRYHTPPGYGRVRSVVTDYELEIKTKAFFENGELQNLHTILNELQKNKSTHGTGYLKASLLEINTTTAEKYIQELQQKDSIPYGPFVSKGTNCSRFVCSALLKGSPRWYSAISLLLPITITPSPLWNLFATYNPIIKLKTDEELEQNSFRSHTA